MAINPTTLVENINLKLDSLGRKADELQTLSERNQQSLVNPTGPIMTAINGVKERMAGLSIGIQRIIDAKATLQGLIQDTDRNLGALEQRLTETISEIDVQPLIDQLAPLNAEIDRINALITAADLPDVPAGTPPGPPPGDAAVGGYVIPKRKKRSPSLSHRRSASRHSNSRRSSTKKKKGGKRHHKSKTRKH